MLTSMSHTPQQAPSARQVQEYENMRIITQHYLSR